MIKLKKLLSEAEPPKQKPPAGGGDTPEKPQKLKNLMLILLRIQIH